MNKHFSKEDKQLANKLRKRVQIIDHQKDANQDTLYYFMASIFLMVLVEMWGHWYVWLFYITQNSMSGSVLPKSKVETQMYTHSHTPFITAAKMSEQPS